MKTKELTAAEFASKFGTDAVSAGSFSYYECDGGIGIVKDNRSKSIEVVVASGARPPELSPEDELQLLSLVCGEYEEEVAIPLGDSLFDYEARDRKVRYRLYAIWAAFSLFVLACLVVYVGYY
ncbi:hypothetical protein [Cohnella cellulosilytica]|uniref:Uncharacterized protein n=1 Tax=Cohnella cellulosilytica TaxID=986710 RepID=A0ABW2F8D6_9BACL